MQKGKATLLSLVFVSSVLFAENEISGKVVSVIDGNTVELITDQRESYKILLFGIDSPELGQEYGDKAHRLLQKIILDKTVSVKIQGKDRWGNRLGIVLIEGKVDPRLELLQAGLAWTAEINPIQELETIKEKAREKRKGLWKEKDPTPPWTYRREQTMIQPKFR
ncbi:MAG TPA: thermonuclease family protein [Cyclobacteriaceae bacterium]|jgi:endonuclease YncB( thermonuclease family)|nr:thermonuclease family protein [Cyclobacteriaceae bacterium]